MTPTTWLVVISPDDSEQLLANVLPWLIVLIVLTLIGGVVILLIRRSLKGGHSSSAGNFTLQDLRDLHAAGELSDEQFERAKGIMIGRLKGPAKTAEVRSSTGNRGQTSS